jgi:hypothetical protein
MVSEVQIRQDVGESGSVLIRGYCLGICPVGLRITTKNLSQDSQSTVFEF